MGDYLMQFAPELTWQNVVLGVLLFIITFAGSSALVSFVLVKIPANYFHSSHEREFLTDRHHAVRWTGIIFKNIAGVVLIFVGIVMAVPGVPGPGFLIIFFGIVLVDFPGKRRLEQKLVGRPKVLKTINRLRLKFDKPPLLLD